MERAEDQEILQFILEHLETVPHLEAALLIWQNQSTAWTADLLARRIYVSTAMGRNILEDLSRQGMLSKSESSDPTYMYDPGWDVGRGMLPRIADLYRRQLIQVTKLIHSKGPSSVREFARAFQIKKEQ